MNKHRAIEYLQALVDTFAAPVDTHYQEALDLLTATPTSLGETVFVVLVIKAGILEVSRVFADEGAANEFYKAMQEKYNIDPLNPDTCAEDVLCLREQVV